MARRLRLLTLLLCGLALNCLTLPASGSDDPIATKKEIKQLQRRIAKLQQSIKNTQQAYNDQEKALQQAEQAVSDINRQLQESNQALTASAARLSQLETEQAQLLQAKKAQQAALKQDINGAFRTGRQEYIKLLLNQQQPQQFARVLQYYDYFHQARMTRIEQFNQTLDALAKNQQQIAQEQQAQLELQAQLTTQQQHLVDARQQRQTALRALAADLKTNSAQVEKLQQDQQQLEKVLRRIQTTLSDLPTNVGHLPLTKLKGKLPWPLPGPLGHSFGSSRENGKLTWNGVLISAQKGSQVNAIHHGRVVFADWMRGYGMLMIVDHGDGFLSLYGHNETLLKAPGDWVNSQEALAFSGNSGGQQQAGLYFEIRKNGKPLDPISWCRRR